GFRCGSLLVATCNQKVRLHVGVTGRKCRVRCKMNGMQKTIRNVLVLFVMAAVSHSVWADDTEIFFAEAAADNEGNRPAANVLFLLDTSGSMRYCDKDLGFSNNQPRWCDDPPNRRINMLVDAMNSVLDSVQNGVRIGIGRFNSADSRDGGRIVVPVVDVNEDTRKVLRSEISAL